MNDFMRAYLNAKAHNRGCPIGEHNYRRVWEGRERRLRVCLKCANWEFIRKRLPSGYASQAVWHAQMPYPSTLRDFIHGDC